MILIDPDLDPAPSPHGRRPVRGDSDSVPNHPSAKPPDGSVSASKSRNLRLPSTRALARFLAEAQAAVRLRGQIAVLLTTDATLRDLNRRFRGKNKPTDVLSFPANPLRNAKPAERVLGDIAISVETARRQAVEQDHALSIELKILILHGLVHLAGYDHETDDGEMALRERKLRARLGLAQGLIERASRREAGKVALDGVRRGTRRTQSGESKPESQKPRKGGGSSSAPSTRRARP